jgi:Mn2+/Fe2+ NRAMP family transporter
VGKPVKTLVFAGALNGFVLPIALGLILIAAANKNIVGDYKHPLWLRLFGIVVISATFFLGIKTLITLF